MKAKKIKSPENNTTAGVFEKNIKQVIKKTESFLPFYIKGFSDVHREYTRFIEQIFNMIKSNEENYFGKSNEEIVKIHQEYVDASFKLYLAQMDTSKEITRNYLDAHLSFMNSWNDQLKSIVSSNIKKQS